MALTSVYKQMVVPTLQADFMRMTQANTYFLIISHLVSYYSLQIQTRNTPMTSSHAATAKATTKKGERGKLKPKFVTRSSKVVLRFPLDHIAHFLKDFHYTQHVGSGSKWIQELCFQFFL
jgi:hypothetical protein